MRATKDGIGIRYSYENDEIESDEILEISFSESILLSYVNLTDLFNEWGYLETGSYYYSYQGTTSGEVFFSADPLETIGDTYGEYTLGVDQYVDSIYFKAPGDIGNEDHEYSVKGIYTSVPEPSTFFLLSTGLLVGTAFRGRLF
jgi:hypothetical protein